MVDASAAVIDIVDRDGSPIVGRALNELASTGALRLAVGTTPVDSIPRLGPIVEDPYNTLAWLVTIQMLALLVARERGIEHIAYGVNVDDLGDYRPGQHAAKMHQAEAPLVDAGLSKAEIRELSRLTGLSTWDRPAAACLSSRIPYGTPVTLENVKTVERGEEALRALGFRQYRVRFHGKLVRIEIAKDELAVALTPEMAQRFVEIFKPLGFHYVTIDLEGYRQ